MSQFFETLSRVLISAVSITKVIDMLLRLLLKLGVIKRKPRK